VTGNNGTSAVAMNAAVGAHGLREGGPDRGWCRTRGIEKPLPSSAETIAAFLPPETGRGVNASLIGRRTAAVGYIAQKGFCHACSGQFAARCGRAPQFAIFCPEA